MIHHSLFYYSKYHIKYVVFKVIYDIVSYYLRITSYLKRFGCSSTLTNRCAFNQTHSRINEHSIQCRNIRGTHYPFTIFNFVPFTHLDNSELETTKILSQVQYQLSNRQSISLRDSKSLSRK